MEWTKAAAVLLALLASACTSVQPGPVAPVAKTQIAEARVPTILISLDGFRTDYLDRGLTPNLLALAAQGSRADSLQPAFPSITFPNLYTMVTGKAPGAHGIVANVMEDPAIPGTTFRPGNAEAVTDGRWWSDAEPIWITAERNGIRTATMFWPGSEAEIGGVRPSEWMAFDKTLTSAARVDKVIEWLDRPPAERPGLVTLYLQETDDVGHTKGPDGPEIDEAIRATDAAVGQLAEALRKRGLAANLIIASDHGMSRVTHAIRLDQRANPADFRVISSGAVAGIEPMPGRESELGRALLRPHADMQCWKKGSLPPAFAYNDHRRIPSIVCLAGMGGMIIGGPQENLPAGMHGYDPYHREMGGILIVNGPAFSPGLISGVRRINEIHTLVRTALSL